MKRVSKLAVLLLVLALGVLCLTGTVRAAVVDSGTCGENLTWSLDSDGVLTISGTGAMEDYAAAADAPWYADRASIKAVYIEDTVTSIGDRAFYNCTEMTFAGVGSGVKTIGTYAFRGCAKLNEVTIPCEVVELKDSAFRVCTGLQMVTFEGSAPAIGSYVFADAPASFTVRYYEGSTGWDVSPWTDYNQESMHVGIWVVDTPPTCTADGSRHIDCSYCGITITEPIPAAHDYVGGVCTVCEDVQILGSGSCGPQVTWKLDALGTMTISGTGNMTYYNESGKIPWRESRSDIKSVVIENGVTTISGHSFEGCANLTSVSIPEGMTNIGYSAFSNCTSLESVHLPDSITKIDQYAFIECDALLEISIPAGMKSITQDTFRSCDNLKTVMIPDSITSIGSLAFWGCASLENVNFPDSITSMGKDAFAQCTSLKRIVIPESMTVIATGLFAGCTSLTDITIPESIITIGSNAFTGCGMQYIVLPNSVESIGANAFMRCGSLESITIPASVTEILHDAFYECRKLGTVYFEGDAPVIATDAFTFVTANCYYPSNNPTWTDEVKCQYGSDWWSELTWIPYCTEHEMGEWYVAKEPTCTEDGKQQRDCKNCDYHEEKVIPATGHTEVVDEAVAPGCTETGLTEGVHCSVCDAVIVAQTVVEATGHNEVVDSVVEPTCTERGYTVYVCTICGETRNGAYTDPLGHDWHGLTCGRCGEIWEMPFTDVSTKKFYYEPIIWAVQNGITNGTTETTFEPNAPCTRWQIVTFLWRAAGCPEPTNTEHNFTDVNPKKVYYKAMLWAIENGITNGTTATTFSPNDTCTRWQIVTFLWRYAGCPEPVNTDHNFTDVNPKKVYFKAMLWAVENGITNGTTATKFSPNDPCTRGQIVTFLYRYMVE